MFVISPTKVKNSNEFAMLLALKAPYLQFIFEYSRNSIEAEMRRHASDPAHKGLIQWGANDWFNCYFEEIYGRYKLSILDTGDGYDPENMETLVRDLASSGGKIGLGHHFGSGAKISAIENNSCGILVFSWRNGIGYVVKLAWSDTSDANTLGLVPLGECGEYMIEIESLTGTTNMPNEIAMANGTGTLSVFLGKTDDARTIEVFDKADVHQRSPLSKELERVLNDRFITIPDYITLKATSNTVGDKFERIPGFLSALDKSGFKLLCTTETAQKAVISVYSTTESLHKKSGRFGGLSGVKYIMRSSDFAEAYESRTGKYSSDALSRFNIVGIKAKVCLLIDLTNCDVKADIQRHTIIDDELEYQICTWFQANMPSEVVNLIKNEAITSDVDPQELRKQLAADIQEFNELTNPQKFRLSITGTEIGMKMEDFQENPNGESVVVLEGKVPVKAGEESRPPHPPNPDPNSREGIDTDPIDRGLTGRLKTGIGIKTRLKRRSAGNEPPNVVFSDSEDFVNIASFVPQSYTVQIYQKHPTYVQLSNVLLREFSNVLNKALVHDFLCEAYTNRVVMMVIYVVGRDNGGVEIPGEWFDIHLGASFVDIIKTTRRKINSSIKSFRNVA